MYLYPYNHVFQVNVMMQDLDSLLPLIQNIEKSLVKVQQGIDELVDMHKEDNMAYAYIVLQQQHLLTGHSSLRVVSN